jgi:hypothetical protein
MLKMAQWKFQVFYTLRKCQCKNFKSNIIIIELVVHMKNSIKDEKKRESIEATLPIIFDAIDTNKDGKLLFDEFSNYFSSLGIIYIFNINQNYSINISYDIKE